MDGFRVNECYITSQSTKGQKKALLQCLILTIALFALILPFIMAVPVVAANITDARYGGYITITSTNTSTAINQAVPFTLSTALLTNDDFAWDNLSNLAITTIPGGDVAYMPAPGLSTTWMIWVPSAPASSSLNYKLVCGGTVNMGGKEVWFPAGQIWGNDTDRLHLGNIEIFPSNISVVGNWTNPENAFDRSLDPTHTITSGYAIKGAPFGAEDGFYLNFSGPFDMKGFSAYTNDDLNLTFQVYNGTWHTAWDTATQGFPDRSVNSTVLYSCKNVTAARFLPRTDKGAGSLRVYDLVFLAEEPAYPSWEWAMHGYFNTDRANGNNKWIVYQPGNWGVKVTNTSTYEVQIGNPKLNVNQPLRIPPNSTYDGASNWTDDNNIIDDNTGTYAYCGVPPSSWSQFIEARLASPRFASSVATYADYVTSGGEQIDVDVYYDSAWHDLYQGSYLDFDKKVMYHNFTEVRLIDKMRVRLYNDSSSTSLDVYLYDVWIGELNETMENPITLTLPPGEHELRVEYDDPLYVEYLRPIGYNDDFRSDWDSSENYDWHVLWGEADYTRARYVGNTTEMWLTNTTFPANYIVTNLTIFTEHRGDDPDCREGTFLNVSTIGSPSLVGHKVGFVPEDTFFWNTTTVNTNPWTGSAWTKDDLDNLRFGYNITAGSPVAYIYLRQAYVRVEAQRPDAGTPTRTIYVDGVAVNTTTGITSDEMPRAVLGKMGKWYYNMGNTTPYIQWMRQTFGDEVRQLIDYNGEYTGRDQSGHGSEVNATYLYYSTDNNLSASFGDFSAIVEAQLTGFSVESGSPMLTQPPEEPDEMYREGSTNHIIGASIINGALDAGGIPQSLFWIPMSFLFSTLIGFIVFGFTNSLLAQALVSAALMFYFALSGGGVIPLWSPIVFIIEGVGIMIARKQISF